LFAFFLEIFLPEIIANPMNIRDLEFFMAIFAAGVAGEGSPHFPPDPAIPPFVTSHPSWPWCVTRGVFAPSPAKDFRHGTAIFRFGECPFYPIRPAFGGFLAFPGLSVFPELLEHRMMGFASGTLEIRRPWHFIPTQSADTGIPIRPAPCPLPIMVLAVAKFETVLAEEFSETIFRGGVDRLIPTMMADLGVFRMVTR
jgi:hypothetical protein